MRGAAVETRGASRGAVFVPEGERSGPLDREPAEPDRADRPIAGLHCDVAGAFSRLAPEASARSGAALWQRSVLAGGCATALIAWWVEPVLAAAVAGALAASLFAALLGLRLYAIGTLYDASLRPSHPPTGVAAAAATRCELPTYTILVALYDEAAVAGRLVAALDAIDYPTDRLEVLLLIESHDTLTRCALAAALGAAGRPSAHMRTVVVPDGAPRTKPRALCYGLQLAKGDYVVVYDAEDRPEPDQLRKSVAAFQAAGSRLGCLQARLNVYNRTDSIVTALFTVEYTALFDGLLPALTRAGAPLPLGGTSNHFPRPVLIETGGWDPWNVTEDADLGYRLARHGYEVAVLSSTTWEEAPGCWRDWLNQRTRWQKGWMQTYIVHMRRPLRLWRDLRAWRFLWFQAVLGGGLLASLAHPWFAAALVLQAIAAFVDPAPFAEIHWLWWLAIANLTASVAAAIALAMLTVGRRRFKGLVAAALLSPLLWLAISLAAYRAILELHRRPFHWAKTPHGLARAETV